MVVYSGWCSPHSVRIGSTPSWRSHVGRQGVAAPPHTTRLDRRFSVGAICSRLITSASPIDSIPQSSGGSAHASRISPPPHTPGYTEQTSLHTSLQQVPNHSFVTDYCPQQTRSFANNTQSRNFNRVRFRGQSPWTDRFFKRGANVSTPHSRGHPATHASRRPHHPLNHSWFPTLTQHRLTHRQLLFR